MIVYDLQPIQDKAAVKAELLWRKSQSIIRATSHDAHGKNRCGLLEFTGCVKSEAGRPAVFYGWFFRAHNLYSLERNFLKHLGIQPVRASLFGLVEGVSARRRERCWTGPLRSLGKRAL